MNTTTWTMNIDDNSPELDEPVPLRPGPITLAEMCEYEDCDQTARWIAHNRTGTQPFCDFHAADACIAELSKDEVRMLLRLNNLID